MTRKTQKAIDYQAAPYGRITIIPKGAQMDTNEAINYARQMRRIVKDQGPQGFLKADHALIALLDEIEWRDERCSLEDFERLRAEVERLNRILRRIVEWRGESTTRICTDADAFAAAAEYLRPNAGIEPPPDAA